jgi:2-polyprenyl-3-methyl-5-hydroxy-6-metoxy-1,4-benzoquinol methylase
MIQTHRPYRPAAGGILMPPAPVAHRDEEYDPEALRLLIEMQARHFWYRGRHRFLLHAVRAELRRRAAAGLPGPDAIDLGGGCGGWVRDLAAACPGAFNELALADSSLDALRFAETVIPPGTPRCQIDLLDLQWHERWDVAFLLDVLEHIPQDAAALAQVRDSLRPGGLLFVTTPALEALRSYNDELVHHVRRYSRADFRRLAATCGFELRRCRYFQFFLSPLLVLSRLRSPDLARLSAEEARALLRKTHRVPAWPVNALLGLAFAAETPLGHWLPFPWGTSILGVFEKA